MNFNLFHEKHYHIKNKCKFMLCQCCFNAFKKNLLFHYLKFMFLLTSHCLIAL